MKQTLKTLFKTLRRDRTTWLSAWVLGLLYVSVAFAHVLAPYSQQWADRSMANAPPTNIYTLTPQGQLSWPYVYRWKRVFDAETLTFYYQPILGQPYPIALFVKGEPYRLWGVLPGNIHVLGVAAPARLSLLGNDMNGRDNFSRLLFGGQISLTIGFLSLLVAFPIGLLYGGIAGYFGGRLDNLMMRFAEIIMSIPSLYLLIGLAAILPANMTSSMRFAMVTIILALIGWAGLSRVIRGMVLGIKTQEYIEASQALGQSDWAIIVRHVLPQTASYVIVAMTLGVPGYILAESALSFLGLGIQQPDASWGNMLKEAQQITNLVNQPWMLMPGVLIFVAVLAFNVVGDAVRDTLDPKQQGRRA